MAIGHSIIETQGEEMRAGIRSLVVTSTAIVVTTAGCMHDPMKPLSDEIEQYGFTVYRPPRANHGPGWVFQFAKTFDGKTVAMTVCENLYPDIKLSDGALSFANTTRTNNLDLSFGLGLLEGLVENVQKVSADLSAKSVKDVKITWGKIREKELIPERRFSSDGKLLPISNQCAAQLRQLRESGEIDGVYVVQSALQADALTMQVNQDASAGAKLDVTLYKVLNLKPGISASEKSATTVEINEPRFLGFVGVALIKWTPTNQLGPETATVSGRLLPAAEARRLLSQ